VTKERRGNREIAQKSQKKGKEVYKGVFRNRSAKKKSGALRVKRGTSRQDTMEDDKSPNEKHKEEN